MNVPLAMHLIQLSGMYFSDKCLNINLDDMVGKKARELLLQYEVFTDGLQQYCLFATKNQPPDEFYEEEKWVYSKEREWPFAFVTLCETFNLNAESVRTMLLRKRRVFLETNHSNLKH